jgi:hypothetical protein
LKLQGCADLGALCFGESFDSLVSRKAPAYLEDLDRVFLLNGVDMNYPLIGILLRILPMEGAQAFVGSVKRVVTVSPTLTRLIVAVRGEIV